MRSKCVSVTLGDMEGESRYRGRVITAAEVEFIRQLITQHPGANRRQLSLRLCEAWGWRQANGALRDMVCRGLLLELARAGHLELPSATPCAPQPTGPACHEWASGGAAPPGYDSSGDPAAGIATVGVSASAAHTGGADV